MCAACFPQNHCMTIFFLSLFSYYGDGIRLYLGPLICIICVYMYNHITSFFDYIGGYRIHAVSVDYYYYRRNSTGNVFRQKALLRWGVLFLCTILAISSCRIIIIIIIVSGLYQTSFLPVLEILQRSNQSLDDSFGLRTVIYLFVCAPIRSLLFVTYAVILILWIYVMIEDSLFLRRARRLSGGVLYVLTFRPGFNIFTDR